MTLSVADVVCVYVCEREREKRRGRDVGVLKTSWRESKIFHLFLPSRVDFAVFHMNFWGIVNLHPCWRGASICS